MKSWKATLASLLLCSLPIISRAEDGCPPNATIMYAGGLGVFTSALMLNLVREVHDETLRGVMHTLKQSTHKVITDKKTGEIFGPSSDITTYTALFTEQLDAHTLEIQYKDQLAKNSIEFNFLNKKYGFRIAASQIIIQIAENGDAFHRAVLIPSKVCVWEKGHADLHA